MEYWSRVQAAISAARRVIPPEGHPLRAVCLQAVEAAEECVRAPHITAAHEAWRAAEAVSKAASAAAAAAATDAEEASVSVAAAWAAWWAAVAASEAAVQAAADFSADSAAKGAV